MNVWLSLLGMYRYDNSLFDELVLPPQVVRSDLINNLLVETAELEVIYPDPEIMRQIIGSWSRARLHAWERIADVLFKDYDPFINIQRDEVRTIQTTNSNTQTNDITRTDNLTQTQDITRTDNLSESQDITRTDNLTQTTEVSAFDANTFTNRDKVTNGGTQRNAGTRANTGTVRDAGSLANTGTVRNAGTVSDNGNSLVTEHFHLEGDSAITDAQDVARKEIELRSRYELDDYIINDFKNRFCLLVY